MYIFYINDNEICLLNNLDVDNQTMKPMWVIELTGSHAMFVNILNKLANKGLI